jgi:hypothetical protein
MPLAAAPPKLRKKSPKIVAVYNVQQNSREVFRAQKVLNSGNKKTFDQYINNNSTAASSQASYQTANTTRGEDASAHKSQLISSSTKKKRVDKITTKTKQASDKK